MATPQPMPAAETPRPLTRGELRRQRARQELVADMSAWWKTESALLRAEQRDWDSAVAAGQVRNRDSWGHLPHLLITILTGGLWAPVWLWVAFRNDRRVARTGPGRRAAARRRAATAGLREERRARRRAA